MYRGKTDEELKEYDVYDYHTDEQEYLNSTVAVDDAPADTQSVVPHVINQGATATDGIPPITNAIEARAHAAGVLLSPEALRDVIALSDNRSETLRQFGRILDEAVRTLPREDGWIMVTSEVLKTLSASVLTPAAAPTPTPVAAPAPTAPTMPAEAQTQTAAAVSDSVVSKLAGDILSGKRDDVFALIRQLEHSGADARAIVNGVAFALDDVYRAVKTNTTAKDMVLLQKAQFVPEASLAQLVEVFCGALESDYASAFTAFKIAVAQAFDIKASA